MNPNTEINTEQPKTKSSKKPLIIAVLTLVLITLIAVAMVLTRSNPDPALTDSLATDKYPTDAPEMFDEMFQQSLMTAYMSELRIVRDSSGDEVARQTVVYDLTDMKNVRIFADVEGVFPQNTDEHYKVNYISVPEGVYMSYKELGSMPSDKLGHWFPVVEDDVIYPEGKALDVYGATETLPYSHMGFYAPGIYPIEARIAVDDFIKKERPYEFFSEYVRPAVHDGKSYYTYEMDFDRDKLVRYNRLLGQHFDVPEAASSEVVDGIELLTSKTKLWINTDTARLERVDMNFRGGYTQTIYYYDYNVVSYIQKPQPLAPSKYIHAWIEPYLTSIGAAETLLQE